MGTRAIGLPYVNKLILTPKPPSSHMGVDTFLLNAKLIKHSFRDLVINDRGIPKEGPLLVGAQVPCFSRQIEHSSS